MVRSCAPENLEIPGLVLTHHPGMTRANVEKDRRESDEGSRRIRQGIGVADMAVQSDLLEAAGPYDRAKALSAFKLGDSTFYWITRLSAISVLLILGGIIL